MGLVSILSPVSPLLPNPKSLSLFPSLPINLMVPRSIPAGQDLCIRLTYLSSAPFPGGLSWPPLLYHGRLLPPFQALALHSVTIQSPVPLPLLSFLHSPILTSHRAAWQTASFRSGHRATPNILLHLGSRWSSGIYYVAAASSIGNRLLRVEMELVNAGRWRIVDYRAFIGEGSKLCGARKAGLTMDETVNCSLAKAGKSRANADGGARNITDVDVSKGISKGKSPAQVEDNFSAPGWFLVVYNQNKNTVGRQKFQCFK